MGFARLTCDNCVKLKRPCDGAKPCSRCAGAGKPCRYSTCRRRQTRRSSKPFYGKERADLTPSKEAAVAAAAVATAAAAGIERVVFTASTAVGLSGRAESRYLAAALSCFGGTALIRLAPAAIVEAYLAASRQPVPVACADEETVEDDRRILLEALSCAMMGVGAVLSGYCVDGAEHARMVLLANLRMQLLLRGTESIGGAAPQADTIACGISSVLLLEALYNIFTGKESDWQECLEHAVEAMLGSGGDGETSVGSRADAGPDGASNSLHLAVLTYLSVMAALRRVASASASAAGPGAAQITAPAARMKQFTQALAPSIRTNSVGRVIVPENVKDEENVAVAAPSSHHVSPSLVEAAIRQCRTGPSSGAATADGLWRLASFITIHYGVRVARGPPWRSTHTPSGESSSSGGSGVSSSGDSGNSSSSSGSSGSGGRRNFGASGDGSDSCRESGESSAVDNGPITDVWDIQEAAGGSEPANGEDALYLADESCIAVKTEASPAAATAVLALPNLCELTGGASTPANTAASASLHSSAEASAEASEGDFVETFGSFSVAEIEQVAALCDWASKHALEVNGGGILLSCFCLVLGTTLLAFLPRNSERVEMMASFWSRVSQFAQRCPSILMFFPLSAASGGAIVRASASKGLVAPKDVASFLACWNVCQRITGDKLPPPVALKQLAGATHAVGLPPACVIGQLLPMWVQWEASGE